MAQSMEESRRSPVEVGSFYPIIYEVLALRLVALSHYLRGFMVGLGISSSIPWYPMVSHGILEDEDVDVSGVDGFEKPKAKHRLDVFENPWMFLKTLVDFFHQQYPPTQRQLGR